MTVKKLMKPAPKKPTKPVVQKPASKPLVQKLSAKDLNVQAEKLVPKKPAPLKGRGFTGTNQNLPPPEKEMPPENREVSIYEHTTEGRQELNRVCEQKGLTWGIISTSTSGGGNQPTKLKIRALIGHMHEFEVEQKDGHPQAIEEALLGLAHDLENEQ